MNKKALLVLVALTLASAAQAQLRKCVGQDGKITYSDVLCDTKSKSIQQFKEIEPSQSNYQAEGVPRRTQASVYEAEISRKIAAHLAQNNYERATAMAATAEHHQMIADDRQEKQDKVIAAKAAKRAARPTVCNTYGTQSGMAIGNIYSGTSNSTTVCNK